MDKWRKVLGFESMPYLISESSVIKSEARLEFKNKPNGIEPYQRKEKVLTQSLSPTIKYLTCSLKTSVESKSKTFLVHRLVALTFVDNPDPERLKFVNHKDGNKLNNKALNLEWVDRHENMSHAVANGLMNTKIGSDANKAKLNEEQVKSIRNRYSLGEKSKELAHHYNVSQRNIQSILSRDIWSHI